MEHEIVSKLLMAKGVIHKSFQLETGEVSLSSDQNLSLKSETTKTSKIEEIQKKIHELNEKVKSETELLGEEVSFKTPLDETFEKLPDFQSIVKESIEDSKDSSEKSVYFSASDSSGISSTSVESANFTKFVNKLIENQNKKERLNLLKLHSQSLISHKMMKHSLEEISSQCAEELLFIDNSLEHLKQLATEFKLKLNKNEYDNSGDCKIQYLESNTKDLIKLEIKGLSVLPYQQVNTDM